MKHSDINVRGIKTSWRCAEILDAMEADYRNYQGGLKQWLSGYPTIMTQVAQRKHNAVKKRMYWLEDRGL